MWYDSGMEEAMDKRFFDPFRRIGSKHLIFLVVLLSTLSLCLFPQPVYAEKMSDGFDPETQLPALLSISALQPSEIYAKNSDRLLEIPGAARLMTLYIALEKLPSDELIPVSDLAAQYSKDETRDERYTMKAGDSFPLRYLLLRILFDNSDASAIAVAEKVSGSRYAFVEEMQRTAALLGMNHTSFYAVDVARVERETPIPDEIHQAVQLYEKSASEIDGIPFTLPEAGNVRTARTTLRDLMRLFTALLNNSRAKALLSVTDELAQITSDGVSRIVPVRSPASHLITLSENRISAAYLCLSDRYSLICSSGTTPDHLPVTAIALHLRQTGIIQPVLQFYTVLDDFYTKSSLTEVGETFPGASERAANGELFDLVYLDAVDYVHPKSDHFLEPTLDYLGSAPYPIPVQKGAMTGQVIFALKDGVQMSVRVGSDRDILANSSLVGQGILLMQRNPNLAYTILAFALVLCAGLITIIIRESIKLRYWYRLQRMEQMAKSARSILVGKKDPPRLLSAAPSQWGDSLLIKALKLSQGVKVDEKEELEEQGQDQGSDQP